MMGDGSFQYSLQALYTGVQRKARLTVVVFDNQEYGILKEFAELRRRRMCRAWTFRESTSSR